MSADKENKDSSKLDVFDPNQKLRICLYDIKEGKKVAQINHRLKEIENSKVQVEGVDLEFSSFSMQGLNYIATLGNDLIRNVKFEQKCDKAITLIKTLCKILFQIKRKVLFNFCQTC
jgi:hypothetical protein